jgi:sec-independent protein translocase protein TatA
MTPIFAFFPQGPELIVIFAVLVLLFGAQKLPQLARALGRSMVEFRRAKEDLDREISSAADQVELEDKKPLESKKT